MNVELKFFHSTADMPVEQLIARFAGFAELRRFFQNTGA